MPKAVAAVRHQQGVSEKLARLQAKKPVTGSFWLPLSDEGAEEVTVAERELHLARIRNESAEKIAAAEERVRKAYDVVKANSVEFVFEAVPRPLYKQLQTAHPPTSEEEDEAKTAGVGQVNGEDFLWALATASLVDPVMTEQQLRAEVGKWNYGETVQFFATVQQVNLSRRELSLDALGK